MRTNVVLDESLVEKAKSLTGIKTTRAVIDEALRVLTQLREQSQVRDLRGRLHWEGDLAMLRESSSTAFDVTPEALAPRLVIEPQLYDRVAQAANEHKIGMDRLLTEAIRRYLWELDRKKISEESLTYQRRHAELKAHYLGEYIAMCDGQVVDHDPNVAVLRQRVHQRLGRKPVMITLVEEVAERPLVRHGFRTETVQP
jgi:Arc/MetJ family transcription regulator